MAQLPPKAPNWPSFNHHQMMPISSSATTTVAAPPSWFEEFLDFSSARRNYHRRSVSDPIAFVEECRNSNGTTLIGNNGFEGFDDEQLSSMFSDDAPVTLPSCSTDPSTPSDQNSDNEEKVTPPEHHRPQQPKNEPGEVESECQPETLPEKSSVKDSSETVLVDPKRVKRILANRQSAQRSRVRKLQYISELERSVTSLQTEVSALSPRVAFLDHQRLILNVDNSALKQRIAALAQDKIFKDAHQEALKKEIERLRKVYHEQNIKQMGNNSTTTTSAPSPSSPPPPLQPPASFNNMNYTDEE
ncbi:hypothetical protein LguiA_035469 [Lonicera macranthoides]